jgi:glycosyltransferase involved in cell wall biosynthesis
MRIVHVTGYFAEEMAYQENLLPAGQAHLGHDVYVIAGRKVPDFGFNSASRLLEAGSFECHGVKVIRLPHYFEVRNKGPVLRGLYRQLRALEPDILFVHDVGPSLVVGLAYKIFKPDVRLQFDCHSTPSNARNSLLGPPYHAAFKLLFRMFSSRFDRLFATAPETADFMRRFYGLSDGQISLLPLPGDASALPHSRELRERVREELNVGESEEVLIHTGKLPGDKETLTLLQAFSNCSNPSRRLWIAGSVTPAFATTVQRYLEKDPRITFLGWSSPARLRELFCASDLLVQPGSLSNTFVDAICCGLPILLDDTPQGRYLTARGNGFVVARGSVERLASSIDACFASETLFKMRERSREAADFFGHINNARMTLAHVGPLPGDSQ